MRSGLRGSCIAARNAGRVGTGTPCGDARTTRERRTGYGFLSRFRLGVRQGGTVLCHDETFGDVRFAVTDRHGGVSAAPYDSLNLATHVGDDPAAVAENRARLTAALGVPVAWMEQVHGVTVAVVDQPTDEPPQAD